jgi:thiamine-monophosphate kinase
VKETRAKALGPGPEFDRIRGIWRRLGDAVVGAGDDCAIVEVGTERLALSTDLSVEGVHFRLGWMSPAEVGWRAAAAALSDLAAVAAVPTGVLVSLGVPDGWPEGHVADLMEGVADATRAVGAVVWGGDLIRSERVIVDVAVVGRLEGRPVLRGGAGVGDELWVTGSLGGPAAALLAWEAGTEPDQTARERFVHPVPRVAEAQWLRDHGATAMIDLSDGLAADATHLAAASQVRCTIDADRVPVHPAAPGALDALASGEEYELLLSLPAGPAEALSPPFREQFGLALTRIGMVEDGEGVGVTHQGRPVEIANAFRHF